MRPLRLFLLLILVVPFAVYAQAPAPKPDWPVIRWEVGKPSSRFAVYEGHDVKALAYNGTSIVVIYDDSGDYLAFLVHVTNDGPYPILVNPASASTRIETPKDRFRENLEGSV